MAKRHARHAWKTLGLLLIGCIWAAGGSTPVPLRAQFPEPIATPQPTALPEQIPAPQPSGPAFPSGNAVPGASPFNAKSSSELAPANNNIPTPEAGSVNVVEVRIEGHSGVTQVGRLPKLNTRAGALFDPKLIEDDVRALDGTRRFIDIRTRYQYVNGGLVVTFQVVEKPVMRYVKFIGMDGVKESKLKKEAGLNVGDSMDPNKIEDARRTLETYYHDHGYPSAYVTTAEGTKVSDKGAVFIINEGLKQTVWSTSFEGNTIATDARLRTQIESKPPILGIFGGHVEKQKIESDVDKLTAYYRALGFFQARVSRILEPDEKGWVSIRFVIDEGPRYKLRKLQTLGNEKFSEEALLEGSQLKADEYFDQGKLNADLTMIRDAYGGEGHIYCDVQADTRFTEEPGQLDIVYKIEEGKVYRVGQIFVDINGESPHSRQRTVMNRMSLRPGDIVDTRKIRRDEIALKRSQLFINDPSKGQPPKIVISAPKGASEDAQSLARGGVRTTGSPRFQSPDNEATIDLHVSGNADSKGPWNSEVINETGTKMEWPATEQRPTPAPLGVLPQDFVPTQVPGMMIHRSAGWPGPQQNVAPVTAPAPQPVQPTQALPLPQGQPLGLVRRQSAEVVTFAPAVPALAPNTLQRNASAPPIQWQANYPPTESAPLVRNTPSYAPGDVPRLPAHAPTAPLRRETVRFQSPDAFATAPGSSLVPSAATPSAYAPNAYTAPSYVAQANNLNPVNAAPTTNNVTPALYSTGVAPDGYQAAGPDGRHVYTGNNSGVVPAQYAQQYPATTPGTAPLFNAPNLPPPTTQFGIAPNGQPDPIQPGNGQFMNPVDPFPPGTPTVDVNPGPMGYAVDPNGYVDLTGVVTEGQTGRLMFGVGVNSNAGVIGNIVLDEQNFDIRRFPRSWEEVRNGQAWRGAGQRFRLEAAPGSEVSRYTASFTEPYLWDTPISFSTSAFYFDRYYRDWFEQRIGGKFGLGYQLPSRPDMAISTKFRIEQVEISDPRVPTPPELQEAVGVNDLYGFGIGLTHDTRDSPFLPTEGWFAQYEAEYVTGSFDYPRGTIEMRKYFTLAQRADGSGRHVLAVGGDFGLTGPDTPIYDNFFAGGYSTLRGFRFRGASPRNMNVIVGGELQLLGTVEYMMPITADDSLRAVVFCDFGTVEADTSIDKHNMRVAPGFGMRISVPALGPAPIALDFAFPIADAAGDETQVFTFFIGLGR
jgi:outer membrane protein insertion porin family